MAQVEKIPLVFSKKNGIIGSIFLCIVSFLYTETFEKAETKHLELVVFFCMECIEDFPIKNLKIFGTAKRMKNCDYTYFW